MKKYFPGLTAIVFALAFSAFTKPFALVTFKLINDPVSGGIVSDPNEWTTAGLSYGRCDANPADIACTISLNTTTMSAYYHTAGGTKIINNFSYANALSPKQDYLVISEEIGASPDWKITSLTFWHY